ncbi:hypothetical protein QBC37DRAFT_426149 [Rhypophila decipiens]|uniref:Elongator complex protein 6 n=1 Tax=Rhypophila decipiens TaxID=261697 RepID=A0AAN6Y388_9PEZI|nr:hypothetical protein QBC37DRAFT_426149 [Rhypophila decipiens]
MASSSRIIPHLLDPYLRPTETTTSDEAEPHLSIATSVLGASTNWLILRYLYAFLKQQQQQQQQQPPTQQQQQQQQQQQRESESPAGGSEEDEPTTTNVILVSFLRDYSFWKENAGRIGLDLDSLARAGRFGFVDGLGVDLFHYSPPPFSEGGPSVGNNNSSIRGSLPVVTGGTAGGPGVGVGVGRVPGVQLLPSRGLNPIAPPGRQPPPGAIRGGGAPATPRGPAPVLGGGDGGRIPPFTTTTGAAASQKSSTAQAASKTSSSSSSSSSVLTNPTISHLRQVMSDAIQKITSQKKKSKLVLVIDQLDFLLAAAAGGGDISTLSVRDLLLDLRETADTTILTFSADQPLIDEQTTTLEKEHANFVLSLLHEASLVLSLRLLDTGVAKDVSGVLRITAGGGGGGGTSAAVEENEYLYHVRGDGSVRVFERGQ